MVTIYALYEESQPIRYVGLTRDLPRRLKQYQHANGGHTPHLKHWLRKVGDRLRHFVLDAVPLEQADAAEREWIARFREEGLDLLNYTSGGEGAFVVSPMSRNKVRAAALARLAAGTHNFQDPRVREKQRVAVSAKLTGRPKSPEHAAALRARCQAQADACRGKALSPQHRANVSAALRGRVWTVEHRAACMAGFARRQHNSPAQLAARPQQRETLATHRAAAQEKSAAMRRGIPLTEEHRAKVSAAMKGRRNLGLQAYWARRKAAST